MGIDIAKYDHVASAYDSATGELVIDSLVFNNNDEGFQSLLSVLTDSDDIVFGFGSTAHYHLNLFNFLFLKSYTCFLLNPIQTHGFRNFSIRDAKNDRIDSRSIAQFLMFSHANLVKEEFNQNELKELCIQRHTLINEQLKLKIQLLSYLDRVFPELEHVVSKKGIHSKALRAILKEYPTAARISHVRIDRLIHLASEASAGKFKEDKIRKIKEAAKTSVSFDSAALALKIKQTVETLEHLKRQIDEINTAIEQQPSAIESPLHKIKGISSIEIAYIMSAIINISRFDSVKKVVVYAGLDPKIRQSGTFSASRT